MLKKKSVPTGSAHHVLELVCSGVLAPAELCSSCTKGNIKQQVYLPANGGSVSYWDLCVSNWASGNHLPHLCYLFSKRQQAQHRIAWKHSSDSVWTQIWARSYDPRARQSIGLFTDQDDREDTSCSAVFAMLVLMIPITSSEAQWDEKAAPANQPALMVFVRPGCQLVSCLYLWQIAGLLLCCILENWMVPASASGQ